jgi:D-alanyl-D-alanine carboxypeptidase/D-alanyl-D-alanine-endopeptidase (penicillin-binding protein 4)
MGIQRVSGPLVVASKFWMGWEGGSAGTNPDEPTRARLMATRLRKALDPGRWDRTTWSTWRAFAARRSLDAAHPPRVVILGGLEVETSPNGGDLVLVHRSNALESTLRRFNCYSNNDIERVGSALGTADELATALASRWGSDGGQVQLATTSGLGENRLTPRLVVRLLRDFRNEAEAHGRRVEDLLPVAGCDPGTVAAFFPRLTSNGNATSLVGKTGTLTSTDGGIAVLAGFVNTSQGEVLFCVAAPRAIGRLRTARRAEESWVLDLLAKQGGPRPRFCAPPLEDSDTGAVILTRLPAEPIN